MEKIQIREKALKYGFDSLSDSDLLSLIIKSGSKDKNVCELSLELLEKKGGIQNILSCSFEELMNIKGLGKAKSLELLAIIEISKRLSHLPKIKRDCLDKPEKIASWIRFNIAFQSQETFFVIYMSRSGNVLKYERLFIGTSEEANVSVSEIARRALLSKAQYLVVAHNHPSGMTLPSDADIKVTKKIEEALMLMNLKLLDHIIVTKEDFYSFKQNGLL